MFFGLVFLKVFVCVHCWGFDPLSFLSKQERLRRRKKQAEGWVFSRVSFAGCCFVSKLLLLVLSHRVFDGKRFFKNYLMKPAGHPGFTSEKKKKKGT